MLRYLTPLVIFAVLVAFLAMGLELNPREVPSPLVDRPAPRFSLPLLHDSEKKLGPADLTAKVWVLNVWASWCVSCRAEHPVLNEWNQNGKVLLIGLNYKDESNDALNWLKQLGNPYTYSVIDRDGRIGLDWGVYGVPESFVVDKRGIIRYKHIGPITVEDLKKTLIPLLERLNAESA